MVAWAGPAGAAPGADAAVDLITAAGSLDFVDLDAFLADARRALAPDGLEVAYDFGRGRQLAGHAGLDQWYERFLARAGRMPLAGDLCERLAAQAQALATQMGNDTYTADDRAAAATCPTSTLCPNIEA